MTTKLLSDIAAEQVIGGRRVDRMPHPLLDVRAKAELRDSTCRTAYEYRVAVSIGYRAVFAEPNEIPGARENVVRAVADYAYREVRYLAMKAQREIWEGDHKACIATLSELLRETEPGPQIA